MTHRPSPRAGVRATLMLTVLTTACVGQAPDTVVQEIVNGTVAPPGAAEEQGILRVGSCTGVLIRNDLAIVPVACVTIRHRENPASLTVTMGAQSAQARWIVTDGPGGVTSSNGFYVVRLASPFAVRGSTTGFRRELDHYTSQPVTCWGYGASDLSGGGAGELRYATNTGQRYGDFLWWIAGDPDVHIPWVGDIGAPCFDPNGRLAGVTHAVEHHPSLGPIARLTSPTVRVVPALGVLGNYWPDASGVSRPYNDSLQNAASLYPFRSHEDRTFAGTTRAATTDGPGVPCACTGSNVWYSFTVAERSLVYFDTAGSGFDTSLYVVDRLGNPLAPQPEINPRAGLCSDDAGCASGGFTTTRESRLWGVFEPGTYRLSVGGCGEGDFIVHYQVLPLGAATRLVTSPELVGVGTRRGVVPTGASVAHGTCGGPTQGPEEAHWFVTCGSQPQTFSLCQSDGGTFSRQNAFGLHDPVLHLRSLAWSDQVACVDNTYTLSRTCGGTGGDAAQVGARIAGAVTPRGINVVYVEDRTGNAGMDYTLQHVVR